MVYYFESTLSPNIVWVDLKALDLRVGSGVRVVAVENGGPLVGNPDAKFTAVQLIRVLAP